MVIVREYLTCGECRRDGRCAWGPGCGIPKVREFEGYVAGHVLGIFHYRGVDKNFVMDSFGDAAEVPPPAQPWPFNQEFSLVNP